MTLTLFRLSLSTQKKFQFWEYFNTEMRYNIYINCSIRGFYQQTGNSPKILHIFSEVDNNKGTKLETLTNFANMFFAFFLIRKVFERNLLFI